MINLHLGGLNTLEKTIHDRLVAHSKTVEKIKIREAAELCGCSVSKISKFVQKLGFGTYKQYLDFLYGRLEKRDEGAGELERVRAYLDNFDKSMVSDLLGLIDRYQKVVVLGYGPSMLCAQYFEYRFRNCSDKMFIAVSDEVMVNNMVDESTLLILLTVTGKFLSFQNIYDSAKEKGAEVAMVAEEYSIDLLSQCDTMFCLSESNQPAHLKPYEKSRTLFFIFLEEIIQLILQRRQRTDSQYR